jgi:methyltransferase FkbM-like protein
VRPALPSTGQIFYAGVAVGPQKAGDQLLARLSSGLRDTPGYEEALVAAIKNQVRSGDKIVVVGGGLGVTSVIAAWTAGDNGYVECFEGGRKSVDTVRQVARLNGVAQRIKVHHAVVGKAIGVYGNDVAGTTIQPTELPLCNFLELDCEGAEIGILRDMTIRPRAIAVETHGFAGSSTGMVRGLLQARGYEVQDLGWAEPRLLEICTQNDIRVLVGT